jgi:hippurate hydrolase
MIEEGVLAAAGPLPVAAYALHVVSALLPHGLLLTRKGLLLAGGDALTVTVRGKGGHDSQPQLLKNPISAACDMVVALRTFVDGTYGPAGPVIVSVGSFHAGAAANVIPDEAELKIGIRSFSQDIEARVLPKVTAVLQDVAANHGVWIDVEHTMDYPLTVVDEAEADVAAATVDEEIGPDRLLWSPNTLSASEDFSLILNEIPGAMLFLGACPPDQDPATAPFNHSAGAVFSEDVMWDGTRLLAALARRRLHQAAAAP